MRADPAMPAMMAGIPTSSLPTSPMSERRVNSTPTAPTALAAAEVTRASVWASWGTIMSRRGSHSTMSMNVRQRTRTPDSWPIHFAALTARLSVAREMVCHWFVRRFMLAFWVAAQKTTTRSRAMTASSAETAAKEVRSATALNSTSWSRSLARRSS